MRRFGIILLTALATIPVGCTKDVPTKGTSAFDDAWRYDVNLPVPVTFGASAPAATASASEETPVSTEVSSSDASGLSSGTKAAAASLADLASTSSAVNYFGLFAVNETATSKEDAFIDEVNNARATCVYNDVDKKYEFQFGYFDAPKMVYYPILSDTEYNFYCYYPKQDAYEVSVDSSCVYVTFDVAGPDDILWAKASGTMNGEIIDGFNAQIVRDGGVPSFGFVHPTACISFTAESGITVTEVKLLEVPVKAKLDILTGVLETSERGDKSVVLGEDMFIVPGESKYDIEVTYTEGSSGDADSSAETAGAVICSYISKDPLVGTEKFEAGYRYDYKLKLASSSTDTKAGSRSCGKIEVVTSRAVLQ